MLENLEEKNTINESISKNDYGKVEIFIYYKNNTYREQYDYCSRLYSILNVPIEKNHKNNK
jgi:hypothetical protein